MEGLAIDQEVYKVNYKVKPYIEDVGFMIW